MFTTKTVVSHLISFLGVKYTEAKLPRPTTRGAYFWDTDTVVVSSDYRFESELEKDSTAIHELGHAAHKHLNKEFDVSRKALAELVADEFCMFFFALCKVSVPASREDHYMQTLLNSTEEDEVEAKQIVNTILLALNFTQEKINSVDF